jgi:orotidine-5'-phosphate decarboxylase
MTNPVFCAFDMPDTASALEMASRLKGRIGGIKLGMEFFMAEGPAGIRALSAQNVPIFLDLKLHDIPNTVAGAVTSLLPLAPHFMTIHTAGGPAMMQAAVKAAAGAGPNRPKLLGVTVLTSLDQADLAACGHTAKTQDLVVTLAKLAQDSGLDGIVCSPQEIAAVRAACGPDFVLMVPGIRPLWAAAGDQKRVMTPREACAAGATHLVIGRPITAAPDPAEAATRIQEDLAA